MTNWARLVEFLLIWLKKCVVPTLDVIIVRYTLPTMHLAQGVRIRITLVPAVIFNTQSRLR